MSNDAFDLFNTKILFHSGATTQRDSFAQRSAHRRLARLLAAASANDAPDDAPSDRVDLEATAEHRAANGD